MIELLIQGYVKRVETWGSDERVIESARMSTQKGFQGWDTDAKLLQYLWEHNHATPFEFAGMVVEVRAPIFVFREWQRHRTQSYNEASARYAPLPALDYVPTTERIMRGAAATKNRQASAAEGAKTCTEEDATWFRESLDLVQWHAEAVYQEALDRGVPKELARLAMTVGRFSTMRASANLRNWLAFERLRLAADAQEEIRGYAQAIGALLAESFPRTWGLFEATGP